MLLFWMINEKEKRITFSNIFLLPSWNEGLPNAMIEATAVCHAL